MIGGVRPWVLGVLVVLTALGVSAVGAATSALPAPQVAASTPVTGNVTGPTVLAIDGTAGYHINASGGPAFSSGGLPVGNVTFYASIGAGNLTGVSISPEEAAITGGHAYPTTLRVGATAQLVTINVLIASTYLKQNESINISYNVYVVRPYVVAATIVAGTGATVLTFPVQVDLDGNPVGTVSVPTLTPGQSYNLSFDYATLGLSSGEHTFSISLAGEHGLVSFANGASVYSTTFYITGPAPDYSLWYLAGAVAFFGVLFIFGTRVAARRRGALRK